ncbi:hypothetical protein IWQ56_000712, partial [Coemansia nantahalensis]
MVAAVNTDLFVGAFLDRLQNALFRRVHGFRRRRQLALLMRVAVLYGRHQRTVQRSIVALVCFGLAERVHRVIRLATSERAAADDGDSARRRAQLDRRFFGNMRRL